MEPVPARTAAIATATFVLGACAGIGVYLMNSDPDSRFEQVEMLRQENRLLREKIQLLEEERDAINAVLAEPEPDPTRAGPVPEEVDRGIQVPTRGPRREKR